MCIRQKLITVLIVLLSLTAVFFLIHSDPLINSSSIESDKSALFDLTSERLHVGDLGNVQFNGNLAKVAFQLQNKTDKDQTLKLISKSCACFELPQTITITSNSTISVLLQVANHGRLSGKQRIKLEYLCESLNRIIPVQLDYNSVIPVICRTNTIYPIQQTPGIASIEIESTLDLQLDKPVLNNSLFSIIDFQSVKSDSKPFTYLLKLKYPPLNASTFELPMVFKVSGQQIDVPLSVVTRELYQVSSDVKYESERGSSFTKATLTLKRWDGKPFCITKVNSKDHVVIEHDREPKRKHLLIVEPGEHWDSMAMNFTLDITTDCEDLQNVSTTCFVYKP